MAQLERLHAIEMLRERQKALAEEEEVRYKEWLVAVREWKKSVPKAFARAVAAYDPVEKAGDPKSKDDLGGPDFTAELKLHELSTLTWFESGGLFPPRMRRNINTRCNIERLISEFEHMAGKNLTKTQRDRVFTYCKPECSL